ncbi:cAMP-dependent protein kinase regulator [Enteropsectra breve]|nr:cAMP-dependent protein kinase regulator [Enteropsectra breve]
MKDLLDQINELSRRHNHPLTEAQVDEIIELYFMMNKAYDPDKLTRTFENFVNSLRPGIDDEGWRRLRRPSVYSRSVDIETFKLTVYEKPQEISDFLLSRFNNRIPFKLLNIEQKLKLVSTMFPREIKVGELMTRQTANGHEMFIVEKGQFAVLMWGIYSHSIGAGDIVDELALLHEVPRAATIVALRDSLVWVCEQTVFTGIRMLDAQAKKKFTADAISTNKDLPEWLHNKECYASIQQLSQPKMLVTGELCVIPETILCVALKSASVKIDDEIKHIKAGELLTGTFTALCDFECCTVMLKHVKAKPVPEPK